MCIQVLGYDAISGMYESHSTVVESNVLVYAAQVLQCYGLAASTQNNAN
jgi:hypothetical protein